MYNNMYMTVNVSHCAFRGGQTTCLLSNQPVSYHQGRLVNALQLHDATSRQDNAEHSIAQHITA